MSIGGEQGFQFEVGRAVVVPDVHMDIAWVERILARESGWDLLVFLGDYFDTWMSPPLVGTGEEVAAYFADLKEQQGERMVMLIGNHDMHYLEAIERRRRGERSVKRFMYSCSGYEGATARGVEEAWGEETLRSLRLFVCVNGYLLSHAGVAGCFWPEKESLEESLEALDRCCEEALARVGEQEFALIQAGLTRGGEQPRGGLTWQDWNYEFEDDEIPLPQIVGHTRNLDEPGARRRGRSWCIDGSQTCYSVLEGSEIRIREA